MDYKDWKFRGLSFFKEEIHINKSINSIDFPSINEFRDIWRYDEITRANLVKYINSALPIVSTTLEKVNAYTGEFSVDLTYYTDGDFVFTNSLMNYLIYEDFVLPMRWFELIQQKEFKIPEIELLLDNIEDTELFFNAFHEGFDSIPSMRKLIKYKT